LPLSSKKGRKEKDRKTFTINASGTEVLLYTLNQEWEKKDLGKSIEFAPCKKGAGRQKELSNKASREQHSTGTIQKD